MMQEVDLEGIDLDEPEFEPDTTPSNSLEPEWKKKILHDFLQLNKNADVLQKFFLQAENTTGISLCTLKKDIRNGQEKILLLEQAAYEKDLTIADLQEQIKVLQEQPSKDPNAPVVSVLSNQICIRDDMDDILDVRKGVAIVEKENAELKRILQETQKNLSDTTQKLQNVTQELQLVKQESAHKIQNYEKLLFEQEKRSQSSEDSLQVQLTKSLEAERDQTDQLKKKYNALKVKYFQLRDRSKLYESSLLCQSSLVSEPLQSSVISSKDTDGVIPTQMFMNSIQHNGAVNACSFSLNSDLFATAGQDKRVDLWQIQGGKWDKLKTLTAKKEVTCVKFSHNSLFMAYGSNDMGVRLVDIANGRQKTLTENTGPVLAVNFSPEGNLITGSRDCKIRIWDASNQYCYSVIASGSGCREVDVTRENVLVSGHINGNICLWDLRTANPIHTVSGVHGRSILSLSCHADNNAVLAASADSTMSLIDLRTFQTIQTFEDSKFTSTSRACLSPDGIYAARGSDKGIIYLWNIFNGQLCKKLNSSSKQEIPVKAMDWSTSGFLASCDINGSLIVRQKALPS